MRSLKFDAIMELTNELIVRTNWAKELSSKELQRVVLGIVSEIESSGAMHFEINSIESVSGRPCLIMFCENDFFELEEV
jgi:hypothetical protein